MTQTITSERHPSETKEAPASALGKAGGWRAPGLARLLAALLLFGVCFGYVEAAVVVYLRPLYQPLHGRHADDLFPLVTLEQLRTHAQHEQYERWLHTELVREAATLGMLAAVALAAARHLRQWFPAFVLVFGIWDIFYYVFLKVLLDWPAGPFTWDLLFLLPVPWVGPVLAPVLVALTMVGCGVLALWREAVGRPLGLRGGHWLVLVLGGAVIVTAFCWDWRNSLAGGPPNSFNWPLFAAGLLTGQLAFLHALWADERAWER